MKIYRIFLLSIVIIFSMNKAYPHEMWINSFASGADPRVLVTLAFGHDIPLDDFLTTDEGTIEIDSYELIAPDNTRLALQKPDPNPHKMIRTQTGLMARTGDLGAYKFVYDDKSLKGTYQIVATSIPRFLVNYKDKKGRVRVAREPLDKVTSSRHGISKLIRALRYSYYAKTLMHIGESSEVKPVGHLVEIVPETDISEVRPGDLVRFEILFDGKPLIDPKNSQIVKATTPSFAMGSGPEAHYLASDVYNGKAQFRITSAGQWIVYAVIERIVDDEASLDFIKGKAKLDNYYVSLTFNVKQ